MKILTFSYCYPNHARPTWCVFVQQRMSPLASREELQICSPVPWFPGIKRFRGDPGPCEENWNGMTVHRPRFFYFPGILKNYDARFYALGIYPWVKKFVRSWKPDIFDVHFLWPDGVAVGLLAKALNVPYVITLCGKIYECLKIPSQKKQCATALQNASAVISLSEHMAQEAINLGTPPQRIKIILNGVDKKRFHPRDKKTCRKELGLPVDSRIVVTVSHLGHRKGHHEVIKALAPLPDDIKLVIVGGPAQGGTKETLRSVAREVGMEDRLILPGPQLHDKIPLYFCAADCSILASYREGCPNAVLESLACGTPVIASDVGAIRDMVPTPTVGRIVPPKDILAIRQALLEVLNSKWIPEEVSRASKVMSWEEVSYAIEDVFRGVIAQ